MIVVKTSALKRAKRAVWQKINSYFLTLVVAISGLTTVLPMALASTVHAISGTTLVSTPSSTNGWGAQDGTPTYVFGPSGADGRGSLQLSTNTQSKQDYFHAANIPLSQVANLGYKLYDTSGVPASYQLQVIGANRLDGSPTGFTSLIWEPAYNGQVNGPNGGFVNETNLQNGTWWSSHAIAGATGGAYDTTYVSLNTIISNNPNATVVAYGVNVGSGTPSATSYVDDVTFGSTLTNFETDLLAAPTNLRFQFQYDAAPLTTNTLNIKAKPGNNNLELLWNAPAGTVNGYHIYATFPDGTSHLFYQGPNINAWAAVYDGFGAHGQGAYTYKVVAVDPSGTEGTASTVATLYYDTTPPTATFTKAPANGSYINGNFAVAGTAQDNVGLKSVFFDVRTQDGSKWVAGCASTPAPVLVYSGANNQNATTSCTINTANLVDGATYMLRIHAGDNAGYGNVNSDAIRYFTVDKTAPVITSITPTPGSILGGTQTFKVTATDAHANYIYVELNKNGKWITDSTKSGHEGATTSTLTYDTSKLADGTYTIKVDAVDKAGNTTEANYTYTFDNTAPVATITSPLAGTTVNKIVTLSGTVTDAHPDHYYFVVKDANGNVVAHAGANGVIYAATVTDWTWDTTTAKDGTYTVDLEARDAAGNKSAQSVATETIKVDNTAPVVTYSSTTDSSTTPTITGTVNDPTATVAVVVNGIAGVATNNGDGTWSYTVPASDGLKSGNTYTVTVSATDGVGNVSAQTVASEGSLVISPLVAAPTVLTTHATTLTTTTTTTTTSTNSNTDPSRSNTGVLGDSTTTPSSTNTSSNQGVKGDSTTNNTTSTTKKGGLAWYWWLLILLVVAAIIWWIVAASRRKSDDA